MDISSLGFSSLILIAQVQRLEKIVAESEQGLGSATSNISSLKEQNERLRADLEQARVELRTQQARSSTLEVQYNSAV